MMATYKDGHFFCEEHGGGEDQLDGFFCMACLGDEAAMDREIEEHEKDFTEGQSKPTGPVKRPPRLW